MSLPQSFRVHATCNTAGGSCVSPDHTTIDISATPTPSGVFSHTTDCPATLSGTTYTGWESCRITVRYTPSQTGPANATLNIGSGSNGPVSVPLAGFGTPAQPKSATVPAPGQATKAKCKKRKRSARVSKRKKCTRKTGTGRKKRK